LRDRTPTGPKKKDRSGFIKGKGAGGGGGLSRPQWRKRHNRTAESYIPGGGGHGHDGKKIERKKSPRQTRGSEMSVEKQKSWGRGGGNWGKVLRAVRQKKPNEALSPNSD